VAPLIGACFRKHAHVAAICYVGPTYLLRLMQLVNAEKAVASNMGPMVLAFDVIAALIAFALVFASAWIVRFLTRQFVARS
jgi:hypothetical protein